MTRNHSKILFSFICFIFLTLTARANGTVDSMLEALKQPQTSDERMESLLGIASEKVNSNDVMALQYAEMALKIADSLGNKYNSGKANEYIGKSWKLLGDHNIALDYMFDALKIFKLLGKQDESAEILRSIGEIYRASARYDMSLQYLDEALKVFTETQNELGKGRTYDRVAAVSLELLYAQIDNAGLRNAFHNGEIKFDEYYMQHQEFRLLFDSVVTFAKKTLDISKSLQNNELAISALMLLGTVNSFACRMDIADGYLKQALEVTRNTKNFPDLALVYINISAYYEKIGKYSLAIQNALIAYDLAKKTEVLVYIKYSAHILSSCYEKVGKFKESLFYLNEAFVAHDKTFSRDLNAKLASLQNRFELEKNELALDRSRTTVRYQLVLFVSILGLHFVIFVILFFKNKNQKKTNLELNQKNLIISEQKNSLEDSNATKDKFFSIIAHDLRSPIGSFLQIAEMFDTQSDLFTDEDRATISKELHKSARNVFNLLENLLTWSRIQRNIIVPNFVIANSDDLIENITEEMTSLANQKNIMLNVRNHCNTTIRIDVQMALTVLRNLLTNAIKFTNRGGQISISAERTNNGELLFEVADSGIGISEDSLEHIFSMTNKVSKPGTEGEPSSGLGLVLCKEFVAINNGRIWAESELGVGTKFKFTVPIHSNTETK